MSNEIRIIDANGRTGIGRTSPHHPEIIWAHPATVAPVVADADGKTGVPNAKIITDTAWHVLADGSLEGRWFDSALGSALVNARIVTA